MKIAILTLGFLLFQPFMHVSALSITDNGQEIIQVDRQDFLLKLEPFIDQEKTQKFVEKLDKRISEDPVNAKIGESGEIISGVNGYKIHQKELTEQLYAFLYSGKQAEIRIPKLAVHPKVDSELLAEIRTKQIGHYVTYFNSNNEERSHNIRLASEALDSHVVFPGEVFSFNKVVGKRTKEKGYRNAPVIVKGEVTEGIGGGICQVSSTLFNSVDKAGVKVMERYSHSKQVPYVPPGRDATVSWYGPDFTFKNQYNQPLLIRSKVYGGQMSITIYSSEVINYDPQSVPDANKKLPEESDQSSDPK
ncbi:VanW family protein [Halobacillus salinarum]|uniref:VanW family protein n=1 Tax=Halobacillus salinarum TaxID=2932257 RepID=A0ABY4EJH9_9BACI|nr:VanW family protein [Halobacillus salinarum]UOQ44251.1 VanW family protein [Halobacillus salinarum]